MFTKGDELSSRFSKSSGNLVIGYVRRSRFFFCWFFATLDPFASSLQAPRSSSFQAFKFSSLQAFKPSSLFQALKPSSLRGAKHSSLRFNWAYRFCKHENLLEGRGEVQPNCIHTFYNHTAQDQSPAKVILRLRPCRRPLWQSQASWLLAWRLGNILIGSLA